MILIPTQEVLPYSHTASEQCCLREKCESMFHTSFIVLWMVGCKKSVRTHISGGWTDWNPKTQMGPQAHRHIHAFGGQDNQRDQPCGNIRSSNERQQSDSGELHKQKRVPVPTSRGQDHLHTQHPSLPQHVAPITEL